MKFIGHVSTAVLAAAPVVLLRDRIPIEYYFLGAPGVSDMSLLGWVGVWAILPDMDIILSQFTPIKHRGFASHSAWTALGAFVLVALGWLGLHFGTEYIELPTRVQEILTPLAMYFTPLMAFLAGLAVLVHILGDALTKTGVPLWKPDQHWHMPVIGGYAAFDNYFLNAIPMAAAAYVVGAYFGADAGILHKLGDWRGAIKNVLAAID